MDRIQHLVNQLTTPEKASLLDGSDFWHTQGIERLGIPALMLTDGPHGLRKQAGAADHLGLNASVPATCFPPAAGLASSWNETLVEQVGQALGAEAVALDVAVVLGPGLNIKRSPLCGRNFEYFSEDPLLSGHLAAAMVRGIQSQGVGACLKHFAVNNQETERMRISAEVDQRTLREIYLTGFELAVKAAQPWMVMCSYNRINGTYAPSSRWLLTDLLRGEWGFDGVVVSDWGATHQRPGDLHAGLDLEMPSSSGCGGREVLAALERKEVALEDLNQTAYRLFTLVDRVGRLPDSNAAASAADAAAATPDAAAETGVVTEPSAVAAAAATGTASGTDTAANPTSDHLVLAERAAIQAAVLLKNQGLLPLDPVAGGPVAVIGQFAAQPRYQGAGSSAVNPTELTNALEEIRQLVKGRREVEYAPGFEVGAPNLDPELAAQAVAVAQRSAVAVVFLGLEPAHESEGYDRENMSLPAAQLELLAQVAAVNPNTVVVLSNGGVVEVASWTHQASAILEGWLLGQAGGRATAKLLFGRANPSGKLAETIPLRLEDNPSFGNFPGERGQVRYGEGLLVGYRWYDSRRAEVAYPFGHGLSYTTFEYSDAGVQVTADGPQPQVEAFVTVRNSGPVTGREVVQVYVHRTSTSAVLRPEQELRAFGSVELQSGESRQLRWQLDSRAFAFWDTARNGWLVEGGAYQIRFAASSRDVRQTAEVHLAGQPVVDPVGWDTSANEWLADSTHGPWLRSKLVGTAFANLLDDPTTQALMGPTPLIRLLRFAGFPVTAPEVEERIKTG
ncbi:MAG: glycoside hydrolase family 3 C-terminal domain-containing protein [Bifidobacteriaceae bacterium]|jgi:beta-glucosidase|nr:glycoside hydrolase family 3 C-terminal domain-containing protein [Bifidobacteriaceae bacterium]